MRYVQPLCVNCGRLSSQPASFILAICGRPAVRSSPTPCRVALVNRCLPAVLLVIMPAMLAMRFRSGVPPAEADHIPGAIYTGQFADQNATVRFVVSADGARLTSFDVAGLGTITNDAGRCTYSTTGYPT